MRLEINEGRTPNRSGQMPRGRFGNNPPNFGSARSDYGSRAYRGRLNQQGMERDWWDKTMDEVSSWFGDEEAERRRRTDAQRNRPRERNDRRRNSGGNYPVGLSQFETAYYPTNSFSQNWYETRINEVMTRNVMTVYPNDSIKYTARMMGECDCGAIPVINRRGQMLGMITDRDITIRLVANGVNPAHARVGDCMTDRTFACHVNDSLLDCMRSMSRHQVRRMPVVDDHNRVVGIVSQADIARHAESNQGRGERRAFTDVMCAVSEPSSASYS